MLWAMATQTPDVLAGASLSGAERRVVERLVERLREELGSDLHAIWLYGSRARRETPHPESDIDLMVLADGGDHRYGMKAVELAYEIAPTEGVSPVWCSLSVATPEWLHGRREIRSFFIAEVDRDKRVLYGSGLE
jgi:predicted nucleotidyltransferase